MTKLETGFVFAGNFSKGKESERKRLSERLTHEDVCKILGNEYRENLKRYLTEHNLILPNFQLNFFNPLDIHDYRKNGNDGFVNEIDDRRSDGQYLIDYYCGNDRVLAYLLPERSATSKHEHNHPIVEEYRLLWGESFLNNKPLPVGKIVIVEPGVKHQATTKESCALTVVVMKNALFVSQENQHVHDQKK